MFVGGIVVHDDVNVEIERDLGLDPIKECAEFAGAVTREATPDDSAGGNVECGEQGGGSVAPIVMASPFCLARLHRQERLRAVKRLDLALLVDAQNQGALGWSEIKPDDVTQLLHKERIGRQLECLTPVRLQAEGLPDAMDGGWRVAGGCGHLAQRPMRRVGRLCLQRAADEIGDLFIANLARRSGTRLIVKTINAGGGEAPPPFANRIGVCANNSTDRLVLHPLGRCKNNPRPARQRLARAPRPNQPLQFRPLRRLQNNPNSRLAHLMPPNQIRA